MIKRPHNYKGECVDCTNKWSCLWGDECPLIDSRSRIKSHRAAGLIVRSRFGCIHYRRIVPEDTISKMHKGFNGEV